MNGQALDEAHRGLGLGLRLGDVVAVKVEAVAVGARPGDPAVRVLDRVEDDDRVVEDRVDVGIGSVRGGGQALDEAHRASTPSYSLPWIPPWMKSGTFASRRSISCCARLGLRARPARRSRRAYERCWARVSSALMVTAYMSGRPPTGRSPRAPCDRRSGLDRLERAADRVVRDVREAPGRIGRIGAVGQVLGRVGLRRAAPGRRDLRLRRCGAHQRNRQPQPAGRPSNAASDSASEAPPGFAEKRPQCTLLGLEVRRPPPRSRA